MVGMITEIDPVMCGPTSSPQRGRIELLISLDHLLCGHMLLDIGLACVRQPGPQVCLRPQSQHSSRYHAWIAGPHQETRVLMLDKVRGAGDVRTDHRESCGHRFHGGEAPTLKE